MFHAHDGTAFWMLRAVGIQCALVSGRVIPAFISRASDLGFQRSSTLFGVENKADAVAALAKRAGVDLADTAYIGDDYNDLPAMKICGIRMTLTSAPVALRSAANCLIDVFPGEGVIRAVAEVLFVARGEDFSEIAGKAFS